MRLAKLIFPKSSRRGKIIRIEERIQDYFLEHYQQRRMVIFHMRSHNRRLKPVQGFWIFVATDELMYRLKRDPEIKNVLTQVAADYPYPEDSDGKLFLEFGSQEAVKRDHRGSYVAFMK